MSFEAINAVRQMDIRPSGCKFVAFALADYADEGFECYPSVETLASYTGQSERAVQGHLKALEDVGFLTRTRTRNSAGQLGQYRYKINHRKNLPVAKSTSGKKLQKPPAESAGHNRQGSSNEELTTSKARAKPKYSEEFDRWWDAYPEKTGSKLVAFKSWQQMDADDRAAAFAALPVYRAFLAKPDAPKPCHGATFLNQRRYDSHQPAAVVQIVQEPAELPDTREGLFLAKARELGVPERKLHSWLGKFTVQEVGGTTACVTDTRENDFREDFRDTLGAMGWAFYPASYVARKDALRKGAQ